MISLFDTRQHLPATEAVERLCRETESCQGVIDSHRRTSNHADDDLFSFPKIEWTLDESHQPEPSLSQDSCENYQDYDMIHIHDWQSQSAPILSIKRPRRKNRLVVSKSLKSSLCHLAERAAVDEEQIQKVEEGGWGQFVCESSDDEHQPFNGFVQLAQQGRRDGPTHLRVPSPFLTFRACNHCGVKETQLLTTFNC